MSVGWKQTSQIISGVSFITAHIAYASKNKTNIVRWVPGKDSIAKSTKNVDSTWQMLCTVRGTTTDFNHLWYHSPGKQVNSRYRSSLPKVHPQKPTLHCLCGCYCKSGWDKTKWKRKESLRQSWCRCAGQGREAGGAGCATGVDASLPPAGCVVWPSDCWQPLQGVMNDHGWVLSTLATITLWLLAAAARGQEWSWLSAEDSGNHHLMPGGSWGITAVIRGQRPLGEQFHQGGEATPPWDNLKSLDFLPLFHSHFLADCKSNILCWTLLADFKGNILCCTLLADLKSNILCWIMIGKGESTNKGVK